MEPKTNFYNVTASEATQYNAGFIPGLDDDYTSHLKVKKYRGKHHHGRIAPSNPHNFLTGLLWFGLFVFTGLFAIAAVGCYNEGHPEALPLAIPFLAVVVAKVMFMIKR